MAYKRVDTDAVEAGMDRVKTGYPWLTIPGGADTFKTTRLRILPADASHPDDTFYHWVAVHGNLPGAKYPVECPAKMRNEHCPACDIGNEKWNNGHKEEAYEYFASWRALVNVVVLNKDGSVPAEAKLQLWGVPRTTFEDLMSKIKELPKSERNVVDPEKGRDIIVKRKGLKPRDTKYEINPADDQSELDESLMHFLTEDNVLIRLHEVYPPQTFATVKLLLAAPETEGKPKRALPSVYDEDEDEDEDYIEGEARVIEEEPKQQRTRGKTEAESDAQDALLAKLQDMLEDDEDED